MNGNQKFKLLFYANNQRAKNDLVPIYCRIYLNGRRAEFSTPHRIELKHWNSKGQKMKATAPNAMLINTYQDNVRNTLNKLFFHSVASEEMLTAKELKSRFLGEGAEERNEKGLVEVIEYHNLKMKELVDADKVVNSTLKKYKTTLNKVKAFLKKEYKVKEIPLHELKYRFITDFEHYLLTGEGLHINTTYKSIKQIKKIMRMCVDLEWIESNPFDRFKCTYKTPDRVVLSQEELDKLINKEFEVPRLAEIRDVFIFCCYTGFAYSEVHKFKRNDITLGIDGEYWITTTRKKTGERESVPLLPIAYEIVRRYEEHEKCVRNDKLLPVKSNQVYNSYLKEVASLCGINKYLTTHIARHTFATTVTLSNGVPIETVSKMLGHSRLVTTQIYAKVLDGKVSEDMKILKDKLSSTPQIEKQKVST